MHVLIDVRDERRGMEPLNKAPSLLIHPVISSSVHRVLLLANVELPVCRCWTLRYVNLHLQIVMTGTRAYSLFYFEISLSKFYIV